MTARKRKGKKKGKKGFLSQDQQQEILALGALAVALFLFLVLFPTWILGEVGETWFPSGNLMGSVGAAIQAILTYIFGLTAILLPGLLAVGGLRLGWWVSPNWALRLAILFAGLLILLPPGLHVLVPASAVSGALGSWFGGMLLVGLGGFGALFLLGALTLLLLVGTLGWNPLLPVGRGAVQGAGLLGRGAQRAGTGLKGWFDELSEHRRAKVAAQRQEIEAPEDSDLFSFIDDLEKEDPILEVERPETLEEAEDGLEVEGSVPELDDPNPQDENLPHELPSLDHLDEPDLSDREGMERELDRLGHVLVQKLQTFNVECTIGGRTTGPVVTQFEVVPAPGVKVNRIANLDADLALAMKARSIRIVAPIPGKGAVGVEIPNPKAEMVFLREILESRQFGRTKADLPLALGRDLTGRPFVADLARMPHALIAGATGSGKSVCLNAFITSLVYRHTPETLRFLLIDPKMVELSAYVDLPHLRHPVVTDPRDAAGVLKWAVFEMERRYELLHANTVRSIGEFNKKLRQGVPLKRVYPKGPDGDPDRWLWKDGPVPYVVLVVDELADLMMTVQSEVEKPLTLLAQKARAIGIHLLVATQRPSVNVITGLIKANFPTRVAFRVSSKVDSRTIIDQNGADALLGNGDMLFLPPGTSELVRIQGAYIGTDETERLTSWYREQAALRSDRAAKEERWPEEEDILEVVRSMEAEAGLEEGGLSPGEDRDDRFWDAAEVCIQQNQGSTSLLQRRLKIGYGRAARVVDQLHEAGILGPPDGSKAREVLMTLSDLEFLRRGEEEEL
ncbi:MAG: DNA translocase FtsK [Gemmatimonadetes bacterium]|nr:DNA translocase FtsK [Gemmatimonadota bacterium]